MAALLSMPCFYSQPTIATKPGQDSFLVGVTRTWRFQVALYKISIRDNYVEVQQCQH